MQGALRLARLLRLPASYGFLALVMAIFSALIKERGDLVAANLRMEAELASFRQVEEIRDELHDSELRYAELRYAELLENAMDGIFSLDAEGRFLMANTAI